ncbi:DMT family transporter [Rhizobium leguminosarum]|uniref:DMT family transporter n=1 Tax=Rhizobium leguminosarum TaxID=384 RepID=A0AAJ1ABP0_RHILE|nr:DMT family transporter [Rhizobium leguminosarum]MBY5533726.1 DMT family transporter [Rhizobium leguminosarum]MBY5594814.1 DMT family transporter [Rhizobium leguminosarum]MBY5630839.1 DMT family transporter [Rhizobium leguminosarum]MBY5652493.1 DMT family transporter [Rhizobium leguminosarum]MBY5657112.1 DMT family transporter [Rhizobium leguminosarum]
MHILFEWPSTISRPSKWMMSGRVHLRSSWLTGRHRTKKRKDQPRRALDPRHFMGILMMCAGVICLSVSDAIAKYLTPTYSPFQIIFLRNIIPLPLAVIVAVGAGGAGAVRSFSPATHLLRGVLWLAAAVLYFTGLRDLPLAEASALVFVVPIFITILSSCLFRENMGCQKWVALLVGFAGVLTIIRPGAETFQLASLLPLVSAFFSALLLLSARYIDPRESVWTLLLYLNSTSALLSGLMMPFVWVPVQVGDMWLFLGIAVFGTAGMTLMTQAFRLAPATIVAPLDYAGLLWSTLLGWLFWNETPEGAALLGATMIIVSGVASLRQ